jgi:hypothetical protein
MRFMAQMIPDRLPSGSSRGEQRLFAILQKLPDDYLVYYEPVISERYPDFVILAPDLGVIIIEVKGWYPGDILGGDSHTVRLRMRGLEKKEAHPVRQARRYQNDLRDECRKCLEAKALLLHADGPYEGQFRFPFCHFAVLSNLSAEQLKHHDLGDLTVHPHARGEHERCGVAVTPTIGSPPRTWGTLHAPPAIAGTRRFTPTHVGNTPT